MIKLLLLTLLIISCDSGNSVPNYSKDDMLSMAREVDPNMQVIIGSIEKASVTCSDYKYPCKIGYLVKLKGLELKALFYESQQNALNSAKHIKGYRARNWVFDDVRGEPILERAVTEGMKASKEF